MVGDRLVGIVETKEVMPTIRYCVALQAEPIFSTSSTANNWGTFSGSSDILFQHIIFRLQRRLSSYQYEYQYDHVQLNEKFAVKINESFEFLREPDSEINMAKLKAKFRNKEKMTELLLRYYRS